MPRSNWPYQHLNTKDNCGFGLIVDLGCKKSHALIKLSIHALTRLKHRGAVGADGKTGDGCGLLMQLPVEFYKTLYSDLPDLFAVGMVFLSQNTHIAQKAKECLNSQLKAQGLSVHCWRTVPTEQSACGEIALQVMPRIEQVIVTVPDSMNQTDAERKLFIARKKAVHTLALSEEDFYVCSLSTQTIVYKALVMPEFLPQLYSDLSDSSFKSSYCLFHQRFSTNTSPSWWLAQPFRFLAHNGEINTIQSNRLACIGNQQQLLSPDLEEIKQTSPLINLSGSDSSSLDNLLELLVQGGMPLVKAIRIMIPPALAQKSSHQSAFYEYHAMHMAPWDGPAGIVMTDGQWLGCTLDRNGLRPARYSITEDGLMVLCSESGIIELEPEKIIEKGRLKPGQLLGFNINKQQLFRPEIIERELTKEYPYLQWITSQTQRIEPNYDAKHDNNLITAALLPSYKQFFDVSLEEMHRLLPPLAERAVEAVGSMGDDTPMAVFSEKSRSLFDCFRQYFAQVTNPAIDSLRERLVMSLQTNIGQVGNLHGPKEEFAKRLILDSPILLPLQFKELSKQARVSRSLRKFDLLYDSKVLLKEAIETLVMGVEQALLDEKTVLIFSDKLLARGQRSIHPLLAIGAVNQRLIELGLRGRVNLIIETGFARDPHQFACLLAYGATAIFPYLSYQLVHEVIETSQKRNSKETAILNYRQGINKGILKIMSKMGIATLHSYRGSQLFEIMGLDEGVIQRCFRGSQCRIAGLDFKSLESPIYGHAVTHITLPNRGLYIFSEFGEYHDYNPSVIVNLLQATRMDDQQAFEAFALAVNKRGIKSVRDLWTLCSPNSAIILDEVEAGSEIVKRFETAAMSLGALSPEAHQALAMAMNSLGGRSNSGEGGEDPLRHDTEYTSKIKQVASGRFGVTSEYLINADVIQIKIAQGAKPGEGGQLPGKKVNHLIAKLRYCKKGVTLISPPPHHDIYSIEDLAQLIFDLKQVNSQALISVKLVAGSGIGTIAVGVAKAYADSITISGFDGGTGASPLSSIKHAGLPWEFGLLEVHQALQANDLRHKVRLCVEGGLKTGLDIIKAAILGAEEFGFGTAPLIALGCKYLRICHLNNCATGVATQNQHLRESFYQGKPAQVINYFKWLVGDVRKLLAKLGFKRLDDIVGRLDLLTVLPEAYKYDMQLDLSPSNTKNKPRVCQVKSNKPFDKAQFAKQLLMDCREQLDSGERRVLHYPIKNYHRSIGANISGEITRRFGMNNRQLAPLKLRFIGSAGQSFGAWLCCGLKVELIGDANDYVGKGMNGGKIVIRHHPESRLCADGRVIAGNTCLYGATGGEIYLAGSAGERFAIRNSGAIAVVEGVGDHGCEYMTDGLVTVLGGTGINFAAGMTGGRAYVYDAKGKFSDRYNPELVNIQRLDAKGMQPFREEFYQQLHAHHQETASELANHLLENFNLSIEKVWAVNPK